MAGHGRFRRRSWRGEGTLTVNGSTTTKYHPWSAQECTDIVGEPDLPHPLDIFRDEFTKVGLINTTDPSSFAQMVNYPFDNQGIFGGHSTNPAVPNDTATITEVMAKTNPSRPDVSIPQLIGEMKDIPSMLHAKGRKTIEGLPRSSSVEFNFGWQPLIDDLLKMANFTAQVDLRLDELTRLHSNNGLSRNRTVFRTTTLSQEAPTAFQTAWGHSVGGFVAYRNDTRKWGSVNWITPVPFNGTRGQLASKARLLVHGWDASPAAIASTLWELLPWSWFIDYFANIGDYLNANRNGAGAVASMGCVMHHRRTVATQVLTSVSSNCVASAGVHVLDQKSRVLVASGITATMPFLSARQLVTLSSLAQSLKG
jgi:hypothetical protein